MPRNGMSRRTKKNLQKDGVSMLKTGMECGTAAFVIHEGLKAYGKHQETKNNQPNQMQMQMPNQSQWSQLAFGARSISPPPAYATATSIPNGNNAVSAASYVHRSFCNGSCGGNCAGVGVRDMKAIEYPQQATGGGTAQTYYDVAQQH